MIQNTLQNWSYKKWKMYRHCPYSVRLKYIEQVAEPDPDPKYDAKRQRGIRVHDELAAAISSGGNIPSEAKEFEEIVEMLREKRAIVEQDHFFDNRWRPWPNGYRGHWLQVKQDAVVVEDEYVLTGDWKTGKKFGNEVDHFNQMKLYSVAAWIMYPGRPEYACELWYLDQDDVWSVSFTPQQLEKALGEFDKEVSAMFADKVFRPRPNKETCKYCPYGPQRGNSACPVGV